MSWKNQIFKQNFIQNQPSEVDYSKLFNCNKKNSELGEDFKDGLKITETSLDTGKLGVEIQEKTTINNEISTKMRN